jgi:predicted Fe-Mo cluster-binding NifX family protein
MKIALVTDDGKSISAHFGRAQYYLIAQIEDGAVASTELVERSERCGCGEGQDHGHDHDQHEHGHEHAHEHSHDHGEKHQRMFAPITDCAVLIARGMGQGAHRGLQVAGIQPVLTELTDINAALEAYLAGQLVDQPQRVH